MQNSDKTESVASTKKLQLFGYNSHLWNIRKSKQITLF